MVLVAPVEEDDFDRLARELAMESRAAPSNPLKNEADIALASMKKLEQLEVRPFTPQPPLWSNLSVRSSCCM